MRWFNGRTESRDADYEQLLDDEQTSADEEEEPAYDSNLPRTIKIRSGNQEVIADEAEIEAEVDADLDDEYKTDEDDDEDFIELLDE